MDSRNVLKKSGELHKILLEIPYSRAVVHKVWFPTNSVNITWTHLRNADSWDFPGSPVVRTLRFHCGGRKFNPRSGNEDPASHMVWPKKKKKREKRNVDSQATPQTYWTRHWGWDPAAVLPQDFQVTLTHTKV